MAAIVPGHVLTDLVRSGHAPDPYTDQHEIEVQWVEDRVWTYSTVLQPPSDWSPLDSVHLEFRGLDTYGHVFIDGAEVLASDNAHRTWRTSPFVIGNSGVSLDVVFDPVSERGQAQLDEHGLVIPAGNESKPIGHQTSPLTRKAGYQFGWDWGPRLAGPGISREVILHLGSPSLAGDLKEPTCTVSQVDESHALIQLRNHDGWELDVYLGDDPISFQRIPNAIVMEEPQLWWPVNFGDQPLYTFQWTHLKTNRRIDHQMGLRTLNWQQIPDSFGTSFQLKVNDLDIQARGANVVPPDFHDAYDCEGWQRIVDQALAANMNMIRVWGGGVYPPDCFYDACDEHGLLVWQDFMFACSMVPDNENFFQNVEIEANEQVVRLRHRPSLALWCGNNEVERAWHQWGWQSLYDIHGADSVRLAQSYDRVFHDILPSVVERSSSALYLSTSPTLDPLSGDEHAWEVWFGLEGFDYYSRNDGRFVSEYGLQSLPDIHTLGEAGIASFDDPSLQFRQRSHMDWLQPGFDGWDMMHHFMSKTVGAPGPTNLKDWVFRSQCTQAEGLRQALERHRTSDGRYSGSLYWSLNDVWPAVSWSTVDHSGRWKLGHYAARRANVPQTAMWQRARSDSLSFVVFNESESVLEGTLRVAVCQLDGRIIREDALPIQISPFETSTLVLGSMKSWASSPTTTYLKWWIVSPDNDVSMHASALWDAPVNVELETALINHSATDLGWIISSDTYVPVAYLTASVPGHFSDNGMALEAGVPVEVQFWPETPLAMELELFIQVVNPTNQ